MGVDAALREPDPSDPLYTALTSESYTITGSGTHITVQSLGVTQDFYNVTRIEATDAREGNDYIYIGPGVSADVVLNGGDGNDNFTYLGLGIARIDGGAGNDVVRGGAGNDILTGGAGTDRVDGQGGNDLITVSSGFDTVLGGQGNDQIIVLAGTHTIFGGPDDDTIIVRGGSNTVHGQTGSDAVQMDYSNLGAGLTTFSGFDPIDQAGEAIKENDRVDVTLNSGGTPMVLNDQTFIFDDHTVVFDDTLEAFNITDASSPTLVSSTDLAGTQWGAAVLTVNANEIHLNDEITANGLVFNATHDIFINVDPIVDGTMSTGNFGVLKLVSSQGKLDFSGQDFHVVNGGNRKRRSPDRGRRATDRRYCRP